MANKHDARGRSTGGAPDIQLHRWFLESAAYRSLSPYARCLYIEIKRRYFGNNNGAISLSYREAERLLGCSNKPVPAAFRELQEKGFIKPQQKGAFKGVPLATTWILTELPQEAPVANQGIYVMAAGRKEKSTARRERTDNTLKAGCERWCSTP